MKSKWKLEVPKNHFLDKPVNYSVLIEHHYDGTIIPTFVGCGNSEEDRKRIAIALRYIANNLLDPNFETEIISFS